MFLTLDDVRRQLGSPILYRQDEPPAGGGQGDPPTPEPAPASNAGDAPAEPETVTLPKAEADALRRRVAEAEKQRRKAEGDAKAEAERQQREQGQYQQLAEQKGREVETLQERIAAMERQQRVTRIATLLKFRDPADALPHLTPEESDDDTLAEAALRRVAETKKYLIDQQSERPEIGQVLTPSAAPNGGETRVQPLTLEQVKALTPQQVADMTPEEFAEVQKVLAAA